MHPSTSTSWPSSHPSLKHSPAWHPPFVPLWLCHFLNHWNSASCLTDFLSNPSSPINLGNLRAYLDSPPNMQPWGSWRSLTSTNFICSLFSYGFRRSSPTFCHQSMLVSSRSSKFNTYFLSTFQFHSSSHRYMWPYKTSRLLTLHFLRSHFLPCFPFRTHFLPSPL